jgi:phosphoglycolate phosphatase-like HAD superfamily hydrolase
VDEAVRVDAVVFDLDGTLIDTMEIAPTVYSEVVRALGGPDFTAEEVVAAWHIGPTEMLLQHLLGRLVTRREVARYYAALEAACSGIRAFPGVDSMLDVLAAANISVGIFTTATARAAAMMTAAAGFADEVAVIVGGDEIRRPKPAPDGLEVACARLGCPTARASYVGDTGLDLECAAAACVFGIHATWGLRPGEPALAGRVARTPDDVLRLVGL